MIYLSVMEKVEGVYEGNCFTTRNDHVSELTHTRDEKYSPGISFILIGVEL